MKPDLNNSSLFEVYKSLFDYNHDGCYALIWKGILLFLMMRRQP